MSTPTVRAPLSLENQVELRALANMLRRAGGFALAFARVNHPSLKERLIAELKDQLPGKDIVELRVDPASEAGLVEQWREALGGRRPDALFVHGLESLFDLAQGASPAVEMFNFNRGYVRRQFPFPVVFWAPEFAIREFAWRAPDFWSGRSGIYRFAGDEEEARETLDTLERDFDWSLSPKERRERQAIFEDLLREIESAGEADPAVLARLRYLLGQAAAYNSQWAEARLFLEQALPLYRQIGARLGEAGTIKSLGDVARLQARYQEAAELYQQALPLYRQIGDRLGEAGTLVAQARLARAAGDFDKARAAYREAQRIYTDIGLVHRAELAAAEAEQICP